MVPRAGLEPLESTRPVALHTFTVRKLTAAPLLNQFNFVGFLQITAYRLSYPIPQYAKFQQISARQSLA